MPKVEDIRAAVKAAGNKGDETPAGDPKLEAKAEDKPKKPKKAKADKPAELKKYRVKHQDCPEVVVEAGDRLDAIEAYKQHCGILATPHKFKVAPVKDEEPEDDEDDREE